MPVIDEIAADYEDQVVFLAVAGRSGIDATRERAGQWFSDRLAWALDESIWEAYGVFGQPTSVLITGDDKVFDGWAGVPGEDYIREQLDALVALSG